MGCPPMKFLILTQYFPPEIGAPQTRLAALGRELARRGHAVEVVTALPNYPTGRIFPEYRRRFAVSERWEGIPVHRTWVYASKGAGVKRMANYSSFLATSLLGLRKASRPDWIFVESPPPSLALAALLAGRFWRVPVIVNVADLWPDSIRALGLMNNELLLHLFEKLERFVYRRAFCVNAVTEGIRKSLIEDKGVAPAKVTLLPNGVDPEIYQPQPPDEALREQLGLRGKKIILYAGTHGYAHGLEHILEAARQLRDPGIHFLFIGDGSEKQRLIGLAAQLQLQNVTFLAPVSPGEIPRYLSIAECGLAPQRDIALFEGNRPAKIVSIMACAKPVVFSGKGEGARLVEDARAGFVVAPEDPSALVAAIRELAREPQLGRQLGWNGCAYVRSRLSWPALVGDWLDQLHTLGQTEMPLRVKEEAAAARAAGSS